MKEWTYYRDTISFAHTVTKWVNPNGMGIFNFAPLAGDNDTISIIIDAETTTIDTVPYPYWAATCIITRPLQPDSLFSLSIDPAGQAQCRIVNWRQVGEMLIIATNGHPSAALKATVSPIACQVMYHPGDTLEFKDTAPGPGGALAVAVIPDNFISVDLIAKNDLTCELTTSHIKPSSLPPLAGNILLSGIFGLSYPEFWGSDAALTLRFHVRAAYLESLKKQFVVSDDSIAIWQYDNNSSTWTKARSIENKAADETVWRLSVAGPGIYGLFMSDLAARDTTRLSIAPNPARLGAKKGMYFEGTMINEVRIYSADGTLVSTTRDSRNTFKRYIGGYVWQLINSHGVAVAPGFYTAVVVQGNPTTGKTKSKLNKVLVFP